MNPKPMYQNRGDFGGIEDRARTPTRGLRLKLRIALRAAGFTGKFRTDELRDGRLAVMERADCGTLPFETFEGRKIILVRKSA